MSTTTPILKRAHSLLAMFFFHVQDRGIRGVFWADPCFSSRYVVCTFGKAFQTLDRSTTLLNAAFEDRSMDLFGLLGVPRRGCSFPSYGRKIWGKSWESDDMSWYFIDFLWVFHSQEICVEQGEVHVPIGPRTISTIKAVNWPRTSSAACRWMWNVASGWWSTAITTIGFAVSQCVADPKMTSGLDRCSTIRWIQLLHKTTRSFHSILILINIASGIGFWIMPATFFSTTSLATSLVCSCAMLCPLSCHTFSIDNWYTWNTDGKLGYIMLYWSSSCSAGWFLGIYWSSWIWWNPATFASSLRILCRSATRGLQADSQCEWSPE